MAKKHPFGNLSLYLLPLALLLTACPGPAGNGTGNSDQVTVRLQDPQNALEGAYYRVGSGSWTPLSFQSGQASFLAQGSVSYEVALRCGNELQFLRASTAQTRTPSFICSSEPKEPTVLATFNVEVPSQIGGKTVMDGDMVLIGGASSAISNGQATLEGEFPSGPQKVLVSVFRITNAEDNPQVEPIGGKLVDVNVPQGGGTLRISSEGYTAFTVRNIHAPLLSDFTQLALLALFKDGMKSFGVVGGAEGASGKYGVLPGIGGVYLGHFQATKGYYPDTETLAVIKDTGGMDWNVDVPSPWPQNGFSANGTTFTLAYPNAQVYNLVLTNLARDAQTGNSLDVYARVYPSGSTTTFTLPDLRTQLRYELAPSGTNVTYNASATVRGAGSPMEDQLTRGSLESTESLLRNLDFAFASKGGRYTLP